MVIRRKQSVIFFMVFLVVGVAFSGLHCVIAVTDQTDLKLQTANTAVSQAFDAVLDAEKAGANVTDLLTQLNNATILLAQAENANRTGDFSTAATLADSVIIIAQEVITSAQEAQQTALVNHQNTFWGTITFTVIGTIVFVLALFLVGAGLNGATSKVYLKQNLR